MKFLLIGLLGLSIFSNCSDGPEQAPDLIEEGVMMTSPPTDTCLCEELSEDSAGVFYKNEAAFTGVCIYNYPDTEIKSVVKSILTGKLHGMVTYYDKLGNVLVEELYQNGIKKKTGDGAPLTCDCSELDKLSSPGESVVRAFLDDIPFNGKCLVTYQGTNQVYMEVEYINGLLDGFTIFYDREGNTMYLEKYEKGTLIKVIYEEA